MVSPSALLGVAAFLVKSRVVGNRVPSRCNHLPLQVWQIAEDEETRFAMFVPTKRDSDADAHGEDDDDDEDRTVLL